METEGQCSRDVVFPLSNRPEQDGRAMNIWHELIENLAVAALLLSVWAQFHPRLEKRFGVSRTVLFGLWMGFAAIVSMLLSIQIEPGVFIDFRNAIVSMSGLFGGPVAALMTCSIGIAYRISMGGAGTLLGIVAMLTAGILSAAVHEATKNVSLKSTHIVAYSAALSLVSFLLSRSPLSPMANEPLTSAFIPLTIMGFVSTIVAGFTILYIRAHTVERDLLRAALAQSPHYYYVKDRESRFRIVNQAVALLNGFTKPADMTGLSDLDIFPGERGRSLFAEEQTLMETGRPFSDKEEQLITGEVEKWYSTSKVPLYDDSGHVIGLAGVTHDITERKHLEEDVTTSRNLLAHAMKEMSDGVAMFDKDGFLVFRNDQYLGYFPITADVQVPGVHVRDILRAAIDREEAISVPKGEEDAWIEQRAASLTFDNDQDVKTAVGRWLGIRTRIASDGSALVVVFDMTAMKESELALKRLSDQLKVLAETDGLTGLTNRRSFDVALAAEMKKAASMVAPLSLILIDVDHFKAYNDYYGHSAGDDCLRLFATCLNKTPTRGHDSVARYGGEEFAILLPHTDIAGAMAVASRFAGLLKEQAEPHLASDEGILTASLGIAVFDQKTTLTDPSDLVNRADEALYRAKAAGRNCIRVWEPQDGHGSASEENKRFAS